MKKFTAENAESAEKRRERENIDERNK